MRLPGVGTVAQFSSAADQTFIVGAAVPVLVIAVSYLFSLVIALWKQHAIAVSTAVNREFSQSNQIWYAVNPLFIGDYL